MNANKLLLSALLVTFLVAPGCGPGGGSLIEGIYTGPTAPAPLGADDMEELDYQAMVGAEGGVLPFYLGFMAIMQVEGGELTAKVVSPASPGATLAMARTLADTLAARASDAKEVIADLEDTIDTVVPSESGTGWFHVSGVSRMRAETVDPDGVRQTQSAEFTVEFHDFPDLIAPGVVLNGSCRIFMKALMSDAAEHVEQTMSYRSEASNLRMTFPESIMGDDTDLVLNGSYAISSSLRAYLGGEVPVVSQVQATSMDSTVRFEPSGEQTRLVGSWTLSGDLDGNNSAIVGGTLFSTRLGGAVSLTSSSTFDPEGDGLVLTAVAGWSGGSIRVTVTGLGGGGEASVLIESDLDGDGEYVPLEGPGVQVAQLVLMGFTFGLGGPLPFPMP